LRLSRPLCRQIKFCVFSILSLLPLVIVQYRFSTVKLNIYIEYIYKIIFVIRLRYRSCRQYSNCIRLFFFSSPSFSLTYIYRHMLVNIFTLSFSFYIFLIDSSNADNKNPSRLVRQRQIEGSNIIEKKKVWKQNVCQLTPCALRSQSVDDDHWLEVHTCNTCSMSKNESERKIYN